MAQKDEEKKPYEYTKHTYDPFDATKNTAISSANTNATTANNAYTDYINKGFTWDKQNEYDTTYSLYDTWRKNGFSYDFNADALYQQYKDKYIQQGKMAMQDTMGQAAAITGGYGNSYASTVGNQAYQASLQNLNDVIPELYQMAYSMHQDKGQNMLNQLGLLESDRNYKYGVWNDKASYLNADRGYYQTEADNVFNREYGMWDADRTYSQTEHHNSENMLYQTARDAVADAQWEKNYLLNERQVALDEDKWNYQKEQANNSSTGGGSSEGSYSSDNSSSGTKGGTVGSSGGYDTTKTGASKYKGNNNALIDFLAKQVTTGAITEQEMDAIYAEYMTPEKEDYAALNKRNWVLVDDGGINWFGGIDNNAVVKDQYGNRYRADDLVDELVSSGMSKSSAKSYVKNLLAELDK